MKKKTLKSLSNIKKLLELTPEIENAFKTLEAAIDSQVDETSAKKSDIGELIVPNEIAGNPSAIAAFSDGGCRGNPGPGAWGLLVQDFDGTVVFEDSDFSEMTTNNQMELMGVIKALEFLKINYPFKTEIHIFTDSKYVVDGMNSWVDGWKKRGWKKADNKEPENLHLWQTLDQLNKELRNVNFHWVKGHAGHPQNERCDQLANLMMDQHLS